MKITKWLHAFKGYRSTYNVEILKSFNPELQLEDTESAIKSKLIELLDESKGFKFVTIVLFKFKSRNNNQWKWHWWCIKINLYYNYYQHANIFRTRFRRDYLLIILLVFQNIIL